jgi:hypothetical protein
MDQATTSTASANILHCALNLSKKSWLLAIQFPDREQPSLYPRDACRRSSPAPEEQREAACMTVPAKRTRKQKARGVTCVRVRVSFVPCPAAGTAVHACSADAR